MEKDYLLEQGTRRVAQTDQAEPDQIKNDAGGYVFDAGVWGQFRRFLILGTEHGSYYAGQRDMTRENVKSLRACLAEDGQRTVEMIVDVSDRGLAASNDPALFALAVAISHGDEPTRRKAAEALPQVARIGTHLFHFVAYAQTQRGWGKTLRWAIRNWYRVKMDGDRLAYDAIKYRQRDGWSHRDLLRRAHVRPRNNQENALYRYIVGGEIDFSLLPDIIDSAEAARVSATPAFTAELVRGSRLPREALQTEHLNSPIVWEALLDQGMPIHALVRNLANMTRHGILSGTRLNTVCATLSNAENVRGSRLHPMSLLIAQRTYAAGQGERGRNTWTPIPNIIDALDEAFYLAFDNVVPTDKRILLGIDVSGSMGSHGVAGANLTAREAAVAMALITLHAEPDVHVVGFDSRMYVVNISRRQRLDDAVRSAPTTGQGTDCAVPIAAALADLKNGAEFDAIVLYTDNQTWAGPQHVHKAIQQYRNQAGIPTRLIACGLVANRFTVCDPNDPLSMDVVGFDASAPAVISEFVAGRL